MQTRDLTINEMKIRVYDLSMLIEKSKNEIMELNAQIAKLEETKQ